MTDSHSPYQEKMTPSIRKETLLAIETRLVERLRLVREKLSTNYPEYRVSVPAVHSVTMTAEEFLEELGLQSKPNVFTISKLMQMYADYVLALYRVSVGEPGLICDGCHELFNEATARHSGSPDSGRFCSEECGRKSAEHRVSVGEPGDDLRKALLRYGRHLTGCAAVRTLVDDEQLACDCGFGGFEETSAVVERVEGRKDGWISVDERLPEMLKKVWVWDEFWKSSHAAKYMGNFGDGPSWQACEAKDSRYRITHWQPLPTSPSGEGGRG